MFLACGPWRSHCGSSLSFYCCRTLLVFSKSIKPDSLPSTVEMSYVHSLCTFQLTCPHAAWSLFTNSIITTKAFKNLENYKACCDDERCGNVESLRNPSVVSVFFHLFFCAYFVGTSEISSPLLC